MFKYRQNNGGFTILEVLVALVIVGISITVFIRLLGNSSMLRAKVNDYDERMDVAVMKTEQAFLGLIEGDSPQDDKERVSLGKIAGKDINWRVEDKVDDSFGNHERGVSFFTVSVDGIDISSVGLR